MTQKTPAEIEKTEQEKFKENNQHKINNDEGDSCLSASADTTLNLSAKGCGKWFIQGNRDLHCGYDKFLCPECQKKEIDNQQRSKDILEQSNEVTDEKSLADRKSEEMSVWRNVKALNKTVLDADPSGFSTPNEEIIEKEFENSIYFTKLRDSLNELKKELLGKTLDEEDVELISNSYKELIKGIVKQIVPIVQKALSEADKQNKETLAPLQKKIEDKIIILENYAEKKNREDVWIGIRKSIGVLKELIKQIEGEMGQ